MGKSLVSCFFETQCINCTVDCVKYIILRCVLQERTDDNRYNLGYRYVLRDKHEQDECVQLVVCMFCCS